MYPAKVSGYFRGLNQPVRIGPALVLALFVLPLLLFSTGGCQGASRQRVVCRHVIDGDTIVLADGRKVRYIGINAPEIPHDDEPGEPFGYKALEANRRLVEGRAIDIEVPRDRPFDRYGRLLAHVYLKNGKLVSEILVRSGLAMTCRYSGTNKYYKRLLNAQRAAIARRAGIWGLSPRHPERYYIGNSKSMRFHRPWCPNGKKTSRKHRIIFKKRIEAFKRGYCPCRRCRP